MGNDVGLALVGLGWWGGVLADSVGKASGAELVSCFARTESTRDRFAADHGIKAATSWDELLADPQVDGVVLATPHSTHADQVVDAASAGKHVFVEKPLTLTVAEGRRAVDAAEAAGIVLQVGHNRRRQPATRRLKELVDAGELGTIHHVEATLSNPRELTPRTGWRGEVEESPGGGMTGLGVHMVDNLIYLVGRPARLAAFSKQILGRSKLDDATTIMLEFQSGPLGVVATSMVVPDIAITGAIGHDAAAWNVGDGAHLYVQKVGDKERTDLPTESLDTITDQLTEFAGCIAGNGRPETGGPEALEVVAVLEATMDSARSGKFVDLDEVRARR
jgi:predicted dehydrogenase